MVDIVTKRMKNGGMEVSRKRTFKEEKHMTVVKTTIIEGIGWPEVGEWSHRFKHAYVKPVRNIGKESHKKRKETDVKFEEWQQRNNNGTLAK